MRDWYTGHKVRAVQLDHTYIDDHNVAGRFVSGDLTGQELDQFERHYVDCPECMDRVALAQVFRMKAAPPAQPPPPASGQRPRLRSTGFGVFNILGRFSPHQQTLIFALSTLVLLIMPIAAMDWLAEHRQTETRAETEPVIWLPSTGIEPVEAHIPSSASWVSISAQVGDDGGIYRMSIVDVTDRPLIVGFDQNASSGTAIGLRVSSLPANVTVVIVEKKSQNGAYTLISRHPLVINWR